jgi:hypothetical protein
VLSLPLTASARSPAPTMMLLVLPLSLSLVASSLRTPTDRWQPRTSLPRAGSPAMSATALSDLKVYELKAVCRAKGLKVSGRKAELVERIMTSSVGGAAPSAPAKKSRAKKATSAAASAAASAASASAAAPPPATAPPPQSPLPPPAAGSTFDVDVLSGPTSAMPRSANADAAVGGDAAPEVLSAEEGDEMEFRAQQRAPLVTRTHTRARARARARTHAHTQSRGRAERPSGRARLRPRACPRCPTPPRRLWRPLAGCHPAGWLSPRRCYLSPDSNPDPNQARQARGATRQAGGLLLGGVRQDGGRPRERGGRLVRRRGRPDPLH